MARQALSLFGRAAFVSMISIATSGCVADMVGPVAVVSHRYALPARLAKPVPAPVPVDVASSTTGPSDRVPKPIEIFNFHPKGYSENDWRQPFLINPSEGPLKIHRWSVAELADKAPRKGENAVAAGQHGASPAKPVKPSAYDQP